MSGDAVVAMPLFQKMYGGSIPTSPLQFEIVEISTNQAQKLNMKWHSRLPVYRTGFLLTSKVCFGALFENHFYAVAIWGNPVARLLPQDRWLELKRFAICSEAPKNTASRMMRIMIKFIKFNFPYIEKLISYQDMEVHQGTIYKASGWKIGHIHSGGKWASRNTIDPNTGKRRDRPDLNNAIGPKIRWEKDIR